jgi:hypothetical protein
MALAGQPKEVPFEVKYGSIQPGMTWLETRAILGKPDSSGSSFGPPLFDEYRDSRTGAKAWVDYDSQGLVCSKAFRAGHKQGQGRTFLDFLKQLLLPCNPLTSVY